MNPRKIYYSKKKDKIVIVGKLKNQSVLLWTLPEPEKLLTGLIEKVSFLTEEKAQKIFEKIKCLDMKTKDKV